MRKIKVRTFPARTVTSRVPVGEKGRAEVKRFTVSEEAAAAFNLRQLMDNGVLGAGRRIAPGEYTKLLFDGVMQMSDTPAEVRDLRLPIAMAEGRVCVNGLGLGVYVQEILAKEKVEHVTVIELEQDVIDLVGPWFRAEYPKERLNIVQGDAFSHRPCTPDGGKFDVVWHDIWPTICADNLPEMKKLARRWGRWAKWQASWCRDECEEMDAMTIPFWL